MDISEYTEVGYFLKPHGFKGHISFYQTSDGVILFEKINHIILSINNLFTPFFTEKIDHNGKIIFKLEGINTEIEAKKLQSKKVFIHKKFESKIQNKNNSDFINYVLIDEHYGTIGKIIRIDELPSHSIFVIEKEGKEILLPNSTNFIIDINHELKLINYNAPEGLIALYLD